MTQKRRTGSAAAEAASFRRTDAMRDDEMVLCYFSFDARIIGGLLTG
jgi:hypothetical protein